MKITIQEEKTLKKFLTLSKTVLKGLRQPLLAECVHVRPLEDSVELTVRDMQESLSVMLTASHNLTGPILLPIKVWQQTKALSIEQINSVLMFDNLQTRAPEFNVDEYPILNMDHKPIFCDTEHAFKNLLSGTVFTSKDPHKYAINGSLIDTVDGKIRVTSTNGHQLHTITGFEIEHTVSVIVPRSTTLLALRVPFNDTVTFSTETVEHVHYNRVEFKGGGWRLVARLVDGNFPPWENLEYKLDDGLLLTNDDKQQITTACKNTPKMGKNLVVDITGDNSYGKPVLLVRPRSSCGAHRSELTLITSKEHSEPLDVRVNADYLVNILKLDKEPVTIDTKNDMLRVKGANWNHIIMGIRR